MNINNKRRREKSLCNVKSESSLSIPDTRERKVVMDKQVLGRSKTIFSFDMAWTAQKAEELAGVHRHTNIKVFGRVNWWWSSPAQSFLVPSSAGFVVIFYSHDFQSRAIHNRPQRNGQ
jgi:hypothetical protein